MKVNTILFILCLVLCSCSSQKSTETFAYFGTYTKGSSEGIYFSKLDTETGEISSPELAVKIDNPSFIAIHPNKQYLFSVIEASGDKAAVVSFKIESDGTLTKINQQPAKGDYPCHLSVDATGKVLLVANYNGATCRSYPIYSDGQIGMGTTYKHTGSSVNKKRQNAPHLHSINVDPANKRAFVADLGIDRVVIYNLDANKAKLKSHGAIILPAGGGPRHFSFQPSGKFAYANLELTREIVAMSYNQKSGMLKKLQILSTLPEDAEAAGSTAECLVHPSGKFVYVSNRGHNSIAAFKIDQSSGELTRVDVEPTLGEIPRGFGIDPSGKFIVAGHQKTDKVTVFKINQKDGSLEFTGNEVEANGVVNVRFLEK